MMAVSTFLHRFGQYLCMVLLAFLLGSGTSLAGLSGRLEISPEKPSPGGNLDFIYAPGELFNKAKLPLYVFAYVYDEANIYPTAYTVRLDKTGPRYIGQFKDLPKSATYIQFKVSDARLIDWNNDQMWDVKMYNGSKPVRSAQLRSALSYLGAVVPSVKRSPDLEKCKREMRLEIQSFPDNVQAKIGLASVLFESGEIEKAEFTKRIEEIIATGYDKSNEIEVRAVARAMRAIGRPADADDLEAAFVKEHPSSDFAEEVLRSTCYKAQSLKDFEEGLAKYMKSIRYTIFSDRMYIDLISNFLRQGNGDEPIRIIRSYPIPPGVNSFPPASILNMFAVSLVKQDSLLKLSRQYAELAINSAASHSNEVRPKFLSEEEFEYSAREIEGICHDTYGFILRQMNQPAEAATEFKKACDLLGDGATAENLEHYSEALQSSSRLPEAVEVMRTAIRTDRAIPQMISRFSSVASPDLEHNKQELRLLQEEAKHAKMINLRMSMMNYDIQGATFTSNSGAKAKINDFELTTMDGKSVKLSDLKGKVAVIDFWATWCGPCRASMPYMQKVYEKYKDNPSVQILMVNVWERTSDTSVTQKIQSRKKIVSSFLSQNPTYSFPMFIDGGDAIVSCFGVTGIPTKFFVDKQGKVQFKEVGFPGADVFVEETSQKIDALLNP